MLVKRPDLLRLLITPDIQKYLDANALTVADVQALDITAERTKVIHTYINRDIHKLSTTP